ERAMVVTQNGTMWGQPGFPRGYEVFRNSSAFTDESMTYLLPPNNRQVNVVFPTDRMCKASQSRLNSSWESLPIDASPNSSVMLMYQENGHVTMLNSTPGKLSSRIVSVYRTSNPLPTDLFQDIHNVWSYHENNTSGRLLSRSKFDDGSCYQVNGSPESIRRSELDQRPHMPFEGNDLWCGILVTLPSDIVTGSVYTLYWVWDWPSEARFPELPQGKVEIYTTCLDILII
ncbi:hypothetical protein P154DRAFT_435507, partial [Amniculicola lignicola CBS 123094]